MSRKYKFATMQDVAERAQVSIATVSRVINNDPAVSAHTRQLVEAVVDDLGYAQKPPNNNKSEGRLGLVIPDIVNPYFPLLLKGITNVAKVNGLEIVLGNSDGDPDTELYHFETMLARGVDGIIHIPFQEGGNAIVKKLVEEAFPVVFLDRELALENICSVTSNNEEGAYQATTYLLNLGHRDIVFISGPPHFSTSVMREAGFRRGLTEFGLPYRKEMVLFADTTQESARREMLRFLDGEKQPFTAVFASNDHMAFGAWQALESKGRRIGDDVSIIGYDDIPFSEFVSLTTIAQPGYEIGRNALILLIDLVNGRREPPQRIVLRDSLIIRRSCKRV